MTTNEATERPAPAHSARKGDLCGAEIRTSVTYQDHRGRVDATCWVLAQVISATRDGWAKKVRYTSQGGYETTATVRFPRCGPVHTPIAQVLVIPRERVRFREGLLIAIGGQRYGTAGELRRALRPFIWGHV